MYNRIGFGVDWDLRQQFQVQVLRVQAAARPQQLGILFHLPVFLTVHFHLALDANDVEGDVEDAPEVVDAGCQVPLHVLQRQVQVH